MNVKPDAQTIRWARESDPEANFDGIWVTASQLSRIVDEAVESLRPLNLRLMLLRGALAEYGISAFVAHEDIEPTREWQDEIELALSTMDAMLAVLSPGFKESNWTDQEVGFAVGRKIPIVALRLGLDPYGFIARYQAVQVKGEKVGAVAQEIFTILMRKPTLSEKLLSVMIEIFARSSSFQNARDNMTTLEKNCTYLTQEMVERLKRAVSENYE